MTANVFWALSTASKIIYEVCKAITEHFDSKCIRLPRTEEEMIQKPSEVESKYGIIRHLAVLMVPMFQHYVLLKISRIIFVICFFSLIVHELVITRVFLQMWTLQMTWLCPRCQSVLQFKNEQKLAGAKATNNTPIITSRLWKSWKLFYRWSCIPSDTLLYERI